MADASALPFNRLSLAPVDEALIAEAAASRLSFSVAKSNTVAAADKSADNLTPSLNCPLLNGFDVAVEAAAVVVVVVVLVTAEVLLLELEELNFVPFELRR